MNKNLGYKIRVPKEDDKQQSEKAIQLLNELFFLNDEIEPSIWIGGMLSIIVNAYYNNNVPLNAFIGEMNLAIESYKGILVENDK